MSSRKGKNAGIISEFVYRLPSDAQEWLVSINKCLRKLAKSFTWNSVADLFTLKTWIMFLATYFAVVFVALCLLCLKDVYHALRGTEKDSEKSNVSLQFLKDRFQTSPPRTKKKNN